VGEVHCVTLVCLMLLDVALVMFYALSVCSRLYCCQSVNVFVLVAGIGDTAVTSSYIPPVV